MPTTTVDARVRPHSHKLDQITLTPEDAAEILDSSTLHNRKLRHSKIKQYANDMAAGRWKPDADVIQFDTNLELLNGFHRLHAVVRAGIPVTFNVIYDVERSAVAYIDIGVKRTGADTIEMEFPSITTPKGSVQALVNILHTVDKRPDEVWNTASRLSNQELVAACAEYEARRKGMLEMAISQGKTIRAHTGTLESSSAAFWFLLKRSNAAPRKVTEFINNLQSSPTFSDDRFPSAVRALRRAVANNETTRRNQRVHLGLLIAAWNVYITDASIDGVWFDDTDLLPEIAC